MPQFQKTTGDSVGRAGHGWRRPGLQFAPAAEGKKPIPGGGSPDAYSIQVLVTAGGQTAQQSIHLGQTPGGNIT